MGRRPPLLLAVFSVARAAGGLPAPRLLGLLAAAVLVASAADLGRTLGGTAGCWWAGTTALVLQASPLLAAPQVDGELLGLPLVLLACAVGLRALSGPRRPAWLPVLAAGVLSGCAVLVKQDLEDPLVLLAVVLVALVVRRELSLPRGGALLAALGGGAALPLAVAVGTSSRWGGGPALVWSDVIAFRARALPVLDAMQSTGAGLRQRDLLLAALASGALPLLACLLARAVQGRAWGPSGAVQGVLALALFEGLSMAAGRGGWLHYLVQGVPSAAAAAGLLAGGPRDRLRRWSGGTVAAAALSCLLAVAVTAPAALAEGCGTQESGARVVSGWLAAHARPGDSAVAVDDPVNVLGDSGPRPAYPYLWVLAQRTLDPQLVRLGSAVTGPGRADWVVRALRPRPWSATADRAVQQALAAGYSPVDVLCGHQVLHRR